MLIKIGNALKSTAFSLLCIATLEKNELLVAIPMILYGLGTMLESIGIAKIENDIEEGKESNNDTHN